MALAIPAAVTRRAGGPVVGSAMARDDSILPAGHRFTHYRVRRVLGRGGFGVTYLAVDERHGAQVAIKEYFPVECAVRDEDYRVLARDDHEDAFRWGLDRFRAEGLVLASFNHPNVVRVFGHFEAHGTGYIVMAYVDGETLSTRLVREGPLNEKRSLAIVLPIVDGLEQVHDAGYLHRDIKPDNIVIGSDDAPVLLDFGAARRALGDRTKSLTAVVSDGYAPIEQYARGSRQGPWTDIYALGAVLYRCLTGRPLPEAPARAGVDELVPVTEASPHRLSRGLRDALRAALAIRAAERPRTLAAWRQMLGRPRPTSTGQPDREGGADDRSDADVVGPYAGAAPARATRFIRQRQRLVDWLRRQLIGPAGSGWLLGSPVERYPTGVLHPVDPGHGATTGIDPAQPESDDGPGLAPAARPPSPPAAEAPRSDDLLPDDEEDDSPADANGTPGSAGARPMSRRRYVPPSSVGVSFYVLGEARLRVTASAASYRRVRERGASGRFVAHRPDADSAGGDGHSLDDRGNHTSARYERTPFECGLDWPEGSGPTPDGLQRQSRRRRYRDGDVLSATFSSPSPATAPEAAAGASPAWETQLDVRRRPYRDGHILTVVFANRQREAPPGADRAERRLFEARLECSVEAGELVEYPRVDPALLTDEEQEIELRHRDAQVFAIGHGAAANWESEPGSLPRIWSESMPAVEVPDVTTLITDVDEDVLVMHDIADAPFEAILDRFDAFVDGYEEWVGRQRAADGYTDSENAAATRIFAQMDAARGRMRGGVELLRRDADAAVSFRLANRAMLEQMRQHDRARGRDKDARAYRWRPFQLAFLLTAIRSTIDERDPCRGILDLIWFPTGGGKTEAYLGLLAFLVVWRRLRHGEAGGGTAVLMRYTLRLLTRQQFERATRIICALELLRRRGVARIGAEPVTVGLWVGAAASPNTFQEAAKQVADLVADYADSIDRVAEDAEQPVEHDGPAPDAVAARPAPGGTGSSGHYLVLQSCPWCGARLTAPHSYVTGPTEFRFLCRNASCEFGDGHPLPCNVVDDALYQQPPTLLVGTIDKFARLAWEERAAAFFGNGIRRPPELVIQDELHLIAGPLGSVAGVYEAALESVLERRGVQPKYVASTATIRMASEQVRRLYGRETAVFPPPGLSADDSWFARTDRSRPGRLYIGYLAPGLDQQHCLAPLAAALLAAPLTVFEDQQDADDLLDAWWTQVVYHGSLRGVGASHNAFVTDVRAFMRRLEAERREAVRGDREGREPGPLASDDAAGDDGLRSQPAVAQLTSQSTAHENARTFDRLAAPHGVPGCLDAVLATNMISVGVDVDRLAVMVINGQPLTTAEYIQASSRIGRAGVPGLVFANYYRHQARSLSHYENFRPYHESFYRFVEPTSVTPFTYRVRKRALHAALVIALRHGSDGLTANNAAGRFDKKDAQVKAVVETLKRRCRRADTDAADDTASHLDRLLGEWHDEAARCVRDKRGLQYDCHDKTADRLLGDFDGARPGRWQTLHSMRNVEDTAVLLAAKPIRTDRRRMRGG